KWFLVPASAFADVAADWDAINRRYANLPILDARFFALLMQHFGIRAGALVALALGPQECGLILEPARLLTWQTYQPAQAPLGAFVAVRDVDLPRILGSFFRTPTARLAVGLGVSQLDPMFWARPSAGRNDGTGTLDYVETASLVIDGSFETYWASRG